MLSRDRIRGTTLFGYGAAIIILQFLDQSRVNVNICLQQQPAAGWNCTRTREKELVHRQGFRLSGWKQIESFTVVNFKFHAH